MSINLYDSSTGELTPLAGIPYETLNSKANKTVISPSSTAETSATASKSHTENDYFELNGMMVQALDDINIGDTLTEGINYRVTDISTELEIINTNIDNKADKDNLTNISVSGTTNTTESTITSGTFFYKSGILVRAKADIAVNATLTENTNYEVVTAGGLNKLTNDVLDVASVASSAASTANSASSVASRADDMIWKSTDQYSTSKAYSVGDYVIHNNTLYKCTTACSAGSWSTNSSNFTSTTLSTAVTELNSALSNICNCTILVNNQSVSVSTTYDYVGLYFSISKTSIITVVQTYDNAIPVSVGVKTSSNSTIYGSNIYAENTDKDTRVGPLRATGILEPGTYYIWAKCSVNNKSNKFSVKAYQLEI